MKDSNTILAGTISATFVSYATELQPILSITASLFAIVLGVFGLYKHLKNFYDNKKE